MLLSPLDTHSTTQVPTPWGHLRHDTVVGDKVSDMKMLQGMVGSVVCWGEMGCSHQG